LRRWFKIWMFKGLVTPFLLWMMFNSAAWDWLPPLMPDVEFAKVNGTWPEMMRARHDARLVCHRHLLGGADRGLVVGGLVAASRRSGASFAEIVS
jgi:hypothetical protein